MSHLKMLIQKARSIYETIEKSRDTDPFWKLFGLSSQLFVFDQLLAQYDKEPSYVYKNRNPKHSADQAAAEMLTLNLVEGTLKDSAPNPNPPPNPPPNPNPDNPPDRHPLKMRIKDNTLEIFLKILHHSALAATGNLTFDLLEKTEKALEQDSNAYERAISTFDPDLSLLSDSQKIIALARAKTVPTNYSANSQLLLAAKNSTPAASQFGIAVGGENLKRRSFS
jgi:hypothetical protein